jgi:hypothetical protein
VIAGGAKTALPDFTMYSFLQTGMKYSLLGKIRPAIYAITSLDRRTGAVGGSSLPEVVGDSSSVEIRTVPQRSCLCVHSSVF